MFNGQLQRIAGIPLNSLADVRSMLRELVLTIAAEQSVEHFGNLRIKHSSRNRNTPQENSALIIDHWNDGTNRTPGSDLLTDEAHGLWVRHGTGKFDQEVFFDVPPRVIFRGVASAKWVDGSPPTVAATESDVGLGAVSIRLADTTTQDPNIRSGDTVLFAKAPDGMYYAFDSHLDGKIGDVKLWLGLRADVPPGWRILDSAGTHDMTGLFVMGLDNSSAANYTATMGATGGAATHAHTFTSDAGGDHSHTGSTGATGPNTSSNGAHTHALTITSDGSHDHGGGTGNAAPGTDSVYTGITATNTNVTGISLVATAVTVTAAPAGITFSTAGFTAGGVTALTGVTADSHGHSSPSHNHTVTETSHSHTITDVTHSHTVASHNHSLTSGGSHSHALSTADSGGAHTHTVDAHAHSISASGTHTHTGTTDTGSSYPPYRRLAYIERYE